MVFLWSCPRYLSLPSVTPEVKERLYVIRQINEKFNVKRFDVISCNKCRISEMYQAKVS
jgi:predicted nucleic-acid-binding Zn-ribbon protein